MQKKYRKYYIQSLVLALLLGFNSVFAQNVTVDAKIDTSEFLAVTRGLRRKSDLARSMLERTRGDLTNALELAKVQKLLRASHAAGKIDRPK